jgi:hypothetical protein
MASLDALYVAVPKFLEDPGAVLGLEAAVVARATHDSCWILGYI